MTTEEFIQKISAVLSLDEAQLTVIAKLFEEAITPVPKKRGRKKKEAAPDPAPEPQGETPQMQEVVFVTHVKEMDGSVTTIAPEYEVPPTFTPPPSLPPEFLPPPPFPG